VVEGIGDLYWPILDTSVRRQLKAPLQNYGCEFPLVTLLSVSEGSRMRGRLAVCSAVGELVADWEVDEMVGT